MPVPAHQATTLFDLPQRWTVFPLLYATPIPLFGPGASSNPVQCISNLKKLPLQYQLSLITF